MILPSPADIDWDYIMQTIEAGECILLLGPELLQTSQGVPFRQAFVDTLKISENPLVTSYYEHDELFLFPNAIAKSKVYYQLKGFYQEESKWEIYEKIARLKLKLIVNANPDRFLAEALPEPEREFAFFHKADPKEITIVPSLEKPLIYNLAGSLEEEESLLLTHDDLYEFLEAILSRQHLPPTVMDEIFKARSLIFVGFYFEKWYVQLLLRLLQVNDPKRRFARYATLRAFNADTLSICQDQFQIEFVSNGIPEFLDTLYEKCKDRNLLRKITYNSDREDDQDEKVRILPPKKQALFYIEHDNNGEGFRKVIELMKNCFGGVDDELYLELIGVSGRLNRLQRRMDENVISEADSEVQMAQIRKHILRLTNEIPDSA